LTEDQLVRAPADRINFSVYAPSSISPNLLFILDIWTYLESQRKKVEEEARRWDQEDAGSQQGPVLDEGSVLIFTLEAPLLEVEESCRTMIWQGREKRESFRCRLSEKPGETNHVWFVPAKLVARFNGLTLATINFNLYVSTTIPGERRSAYGSVKMPSAGFASYASEDRIPVLQTIEGIQKGAPYMNIFTDVMSLRSGEDWATKLRALIRHSDILYLFWSSAAAKSKYVEGEWRYALEQKGIDFIDPVPLESPEIVPPPVELAKLHFYSVYLSLIYAERYMQSLKAKGTTAA
jgi:TIR domain